jgi:hypothetical protein
VKLVAELGPGIVSETEVARIEHDDFAVAEMVGLTLDEGKRLAAQAEIVRAQVAAMGERFRWCEHCTFRAVFCTRRTLCWTGSILPCGSSTLRELQSV